MTGRQQGARETVMSVLREEVLNLAAVLPGDIGDRARELIALKEELANMRGIVATFEGVVAAKREADEYAANVRKEAEQATAAAAAREAAAMHYELDLRAKEQSLTSREAMLLKNAEELDKLESEFKVFEEKTSANLRERELVVEERESRSSPRRWLRSETFARS